MRLRSYVEKDIEEVKVEMIQSLCKSFVLMQCCNDMHGQQVNVSHSVHDAVQHNLCLQPETYQIQDTAWEASNSRC